MSFDEMDPTHKNEPAASSEDYIELPQPCEGSESSQKEQDLIEGITIGEFVGLDESGRPLVRVSGKSTLPAQALIHLDSKQKGLTVALMFESGQLDKPIILGRLNPQPLEILPSKSEPDKSTAAEDNEISVTTENEKLHLKAGQEITLECGKSSITLTKAGKIIIRGSYLLSRSTGVNKIQGGSIQLN